MSVDLSLVSLASVAMLVSVVAGGLLGLHLKNQVPGLGLRDNLRATVYVTQYSGALEYHGLRRRELRARVNELRANLGESAADGGMVAAIHRLGPARVLAAEVAGERMVPSWFRGTLWLIGAVVIAVFALVMSASAFLSAVESAVAPGATATWSTFFVTMTATVVQSGPPDFAVELPLLALALSVVPFGLGARIWRLWNGARRPTLSS